MNRDDWVRADNAARIGRGRAPDLLKDTYIMITGPGGVYDLATLEEVGKRAHGQPEDDGIKRYRLNLTIAPGHTTGFRIITGPIQIPLCECGSVNAKEHDANGCEPVPIWWGTLAQS